MKFKLHATTVLAAAIAVFSHLADAAENGTTWFGNTADGQWLVGIKAGPVSTNDNRFNDADNAALVLGYQFARAIGDRGSVTAEFEYSDTYSDGDLDVIPGASWHVPMWAGFLAYRTPGTVYFKAKLGILYSDIKTRDAGTIILDHSDTNLAFGGGLGVKLGARQNFLIEAEWTGTTGDSTVDQVTLGGLYLF